MTCGLLERFHRERVQTKWSDHVLSRIAGEVFDEQFLEVAGAGLDGPARSRVAHDSSLAHDSSQLEQSLNDIHVAEIFSQPKTVATSSRMGLTPGWIFDMSCSYLDLNVRTNTERLREFLQTERPVLLVGPP